MEVVEQDERRLLGCHVVQQPIQAQQRGVQRIGRRRRRIVQSNAEDRRGKTSRAGEERRAVSVLGVRDQRLEELSRQTERERRFDLTATRAQHAQPTIPRPLRRRLHQARLADARGPDDRRGAATPVTRLLEQPIDRLEFVLALQ